MGFEFVNVSVGKLKGADPHLRKKEVKVLHLGVLVHVE